MKIPGLLLAVLLIPTMGCGGSGNQTTVPSSGVSGAYEFVVTSNVTGGTTLIEANLAANGSQSTAAGPNQVQILTRENKIWYVDGICAGATPGQNSVSANVTGKSNVGLSFNEGGFVFTGQGSLTGATISGNYSVNGSNCPDLIGVVGFPSGYDFGGVVGNPVPNLAGTFSGVLNLPKGLENVAVTLQENGDYSLTAQTSLSGTAGTGSFTFSGSVVGNAMILSGSVNGTVFSWLGYFDNSGQLTGTPNSILIFDHDTLANTGMLLKM